MRSALARAARATRAVLERAQTRPLEWLRWLPVQDRYLRNRAERRLLRAGNQSVGKTTVALADLAMDAMGIHPYRRARPLPAGVKQREYWVICASWSQSKAAQRKLHALLPPERIHPDTVFTAIRGFRGREPGVEVLHDDGSYSLIRVKTTRQGTLDLSAATIQGALFDEVPASQEVYSEVCKRVQSTGGWVAIAATMVGAPVDWVKAEVDEGRLEDIHTRLTPEALIPIGSRHPRRTATGEPMNAEWIAGIEAKTPPHEREVRVHGGWEIRVTDRYFDIFISDPATPDAHVHPRAPSGRLSVCLGIDHGHRPGKQGAILCFVQEKHPSGHPYVYVVDEYTDESGSPLPERDARGILDMLERHDLRWSSLDHVWGDRVHMPGTGQQKSNRDLQVQIGKQLKVPHRELVPQIRTVAKGAGSTSVGERWLYQAMVRGTLAIHPRCVRLIESLDRYVCVDDGSKDLVDALRYAVSPYIFGWWRRTGGSGLVVS